MSRIYRVSGLFLGLVACFLFISCQNHFQTPSGNTQSGTPFPVATPMPIPAPVAVSGSYCTTWVQGTWHPNGTSPVNLSCEQPSGLWQTVGGFPESPPAPINNNYYDDASLAKAANGDLYLSYSRWRKPAQEKEHLVARYHAGTGWTQVTNVPVNSSGGSIIPATTQFGGKIFEFNGSPFYFWEGSVQGILSTPSGNGWSQMPVDPQSGTSQRHPEALVSATGNLVYLYFGEPTPKVIMYDGNTLTSLGGPTVNSANEYTLYTSLAQWNGQLVMAYSSSNTPLTNVWDNVVDEVKVAFYNNGSWGTSMAGIQDTPGHDGVNPFLFTVNGNLYVMYSDYSTTGLPAIHDQVSFRFRVKQWNGSTWVRVGGESDVVNLSQRFEFLNDNGAILVGVIQNTDARNSRMVVLTWQNGQFGYSGGVVRTLPSSGFNMTYRPGAVVRLN